MGKHTAFIENKAVFEVLVNGETIERLVVHPNMLLIPRPGDLYALVVHDGAVKQDPVTLKVKEVQLRHIVSRKYTDDQIETLLAQRIFVVCEHVNVQPTGGRLPHAPLELLES